MRPSGGLSELQVQSARWTEALPTPLVSPSLLTRLAPPLQATPLVQVEQPPSQLCLQADQRPIGVFGVSFASDWLLILRPRYAGQQCLLQERRLGALAYCEWGWSEGWHLRRRPAACTAQSSARLAATDGVSHRSQAAWVAKAQQLAELPQRIMAWTMAWIRPTSDEDHPSPTALRLKQQHAPLASLLQTACSLAYQNPA